MSVETPSERTGAGRYADAGPAYVEPEGQGWMTFAGIILACFGLINIVGGIAAIDDANFYVGNAEFQIGDLNTWGWVLLLTGTMQLLAAFGIFARNQFARWLGVGFASINMIAQLFLISAFPLWCLAIFAVDLLVIYGLTVHGERAERAA